MGVHGRLSQADFDPNGVPEKSSATDFVRHVRAGMESSRHEYLC